MSLSPDCLDLRDLDPAETRFGGKAQGLARLLRSGARVPAGFAVAASAGPPEAWPDALHQDVRLRVAALLARGPVAVRSSAMGEDGETRSFAGLFDTVLGRRTEAEALAAMSLVAESGASPRVYAYAGRVVPVGLVVQAMVAPRAAGVLFTVDPSGAGPGALLEATVGLGDALVAGHAAPERWRVQTDGLGRMVATREVSAPSRALSEDEAVALVGAAQRLAAAAGRPLDLEWAIDADGLPVWLQARPITAARPYAAPVIERSAPAANDGPVSVWSNFNVRETMPEPLSPLAWSVWKETILPFLSRDLLGLRESDPAFAQGGALDRINGRVMFNINALHGAPALGGALIQQLATIDTAAAETLGRLLETGVLQPRAFPGGRRLRLLAMGRVLTGSVGRLGASLRPEVALRRLRETSRVFDQAPPVAGLDPAALVAELRCFGSPEARTLQSGLGLALAAILIWQLAERLWAPWPEARRRLAQGTPDNPTTAISVAVDALVAAARPIAACFAGPAEGLHDMLRRNMDPEVVAWVAELDAFLAEHGQRCPREFDVAVPRWRDDPTPILALVQQGLRDPSPEPVRARLERLAAERDAAIAAAKLPFGRGRFLRWLAAQVPRWMPLREAPKHEAMRAFSRIRCAAVEAGRRLAARDQIAATDDVFYLEVQEISAALQDPTADLRAQVEARRAQLHSFQQMAPLAYLRSDGVPVPVAAPTQRGLQGAGVGGGIGVGPVVILDEPDAGLLPAGAVLVVRLADPAWTPLFSRAAAVIMEVGGLACHAAVVARELGIPTVVGLSGATLALPPGARVRVDGDRGTVEILPEPAPPEEVTMQAGYADLPTDLQTELTDQG